MSGIRFALGDLNPTLRKQAEKRLQQQSNVRTVRCEDVSTRDAEVKPKNKYNATRVKAGGHTFDSKHEYREYLKLLAREQAGEIEGLRVQVRFALFDPGENCRGEWIGSYRADFVYREAGKIKVADAKSEATRARREWPRTKSLMRACFGHEVLEL